MTFEENLPAIIVIGYAAVAGLGWLGAGLRKRTRPRAGAASIAVAWTLGIAITLTWLFVAVGVRGFVTILLVLFVVPSALVYLGSVLGRQRRRRAGGEISAVWPLLLIGGAGLAFSLVTANTLVNGLSYFLGFAYDVDLVVTDSFDSGGSTSNDTVSGTYSHGGTEHSVHKATWYGPRPVPEPGEVTDVSVGPLWPYPVLMSPLGAGLQLLIALVCAVPGALLARAALKKDTGHGATSGKAAEHPSTTEQEGTR